MKVHDTAHTAIPQQFCTGLGQSDTHVLKLSGGRNNTNQSKGTPYNTITAEEIVSMASQPSSVPKDKAQWFIPSTYAEHDGREHSAQREHGEYWWLCIDIDKGNQSLEIVRAAMKSAVGEVSLLIYSTSGATPDNRKWRVLMPVKRPLRGVDYGDTQSALFDMLAAQGIECDRALERPGQLVYLPNRGVFYEHHVEKHQRLDLTDHPITRHRDCKRQLQVESEADAKAARDRKAADREDSFA